MTFQIVYVLYKVTLTNFRSVYNCSIEYRFYSLSVCSYKVSSHAAKCSALPCSQRLNTKQNNTAFATVGINNHCYPVISA